MATEWTPLQLASIIQKFVSDTVRGAMDSHVIEYHDEEPPPEPPDPPDPPEPPPPPTGNTGLAGGVELSGWWDGWLARGNGGMGNYKPAKFFDHGDYGEMRNNTNACKKLPGEGHPGWSRGWFEIDIRISGQDFWPGGGGQHIIGMMSQSAPQAGPYDPAIPNLNGWLRLDFGVREDALQPTIYQDGEPKTFNPTGQIPFDCLGQWKTLRVEWEQRGDRVEFVINGRSFTARTQPGLNPIGNLLVVGNMDTNRGARCRGDHDPCGLIGRVGYRNLSFGH
jgi:hypothetical protein